MFLEHDLLAGVNRHLDRIEREPRFGFLLGRLYHCPETDLEYAVADTAVAAREILSEEASGAYIIRAWSEAQAVFSGHSGLLLGWYHSHYRFGLMPTEADRDTIARYFDAPWQLSIIVVPDRARPLGAVFRTPPADSGGGDRDRPAAFYELSPAPHGGDIGRAHSAVTWANYQAHAPAVPVFGPAEEFQAPQDEAVAEEVIADAEVEEARAEGAVTEEPAARAAEEAEPAAEEPPPEEPPLAEETPPPSPPSSPRVSLWEGEDEPESAAEHPPLSGAAPEAAGGPSGVRMPPPKTAEPTGDFPGPQEERRPPDRPMPPGDRSIRGVPLVMPGEKADMNLLPPRSRRIPWRVVAAGAALLTLALILLWPDASTVSTGRTGPNPSSADGDAVVSAELRQFLEDVDALEIAGERYDERAADFDAGRIGCDLLTTGYVAADEAYVRVAAAYADSGVRSNPRSADAYEEAGAEIADINSHFDGSGCPRP